MRVAVLVVAVVVALVAALVARADSGACRVVTISYPEERWPSATIDLDGDGLADYVIEVNPWNIASASGEAVETYYYCNHTLVYHMALDNVVLVNPGAWVHGYPEIWYGNKPWNSLYATDGPVRLPARLSEAQGFYVTVAYRLEPAEGLPVNLAIESWLTRDEWRSSGVMPGEQELMIWLYWSGLQPAGSKIGEITVPILVNGTPVNATFEVWKGTVGTGWEYIAFRITTPLKAANVTLPYMPFIREAARVTSIENYTSLYLEDVELGTEYGSPSTTSDHMDWVIYDFHLTPAETSMLGNETPAPPAPGNGTTPQPPSQPQPEPPSSSQQPGATTGNVTVELVNTWGSGAQYQVTISLDSPGANWELLVKTSAEIVDAWGAKPAGTRDGYTVLAPEPWNQGPQATVGFITSGASPLVEQVVLLVNGEPVANWTAPRPSPGSLEAELSIESSWGTGYVAKIVITNRGTAPVADWRLVLDTTSRIVSIWGATVLAANETSVILGPASYTAVIPPGGSVELGFVAEVAGPKPYPTLAAIYTPQ